MRTDDDLALDEIKSEFQKWETEIAEFARAVGHDESLRIPLEDMQSQYQKLKGQFAEVSAKLERTNIPILNHISLEEAKFIVRRLANVPVARYDSVTEEIFCELLEGDEPPSLCIRQAAADQLRDFYRGVPIRQRRYWRNIHKLAGMPALVKATQEGGRISAEEAWDAMARMHGSSVETLRQRVKRARRRLRGVTFAKK